MGITIVNYIDQALADTVTAQALKRAEQAKAAAAAAAKASETSSSDFASALENASNSAAGTQENTSSPVSCPIDLEALFTEASTTYNVSEKLLKCIAKTESNFDPNAVSSKGAVGIMQLMPATAASLGVSNSYDARENIMGGANLISQLLTKYEGNVSLALAAYNAGSNNVDTYGGIPPFTETQEYVNKVLSYMDTDIAVPAAADTSASATTNGTADNTNSANTDSAGAANGTADNTSPAADAAKNTDSSAAPSGKITVTVINSILPEAAKDDIVKESISEADDAGLSSLLLLADEDRQKTNDALDAYFASRGISLEKLQALVEQSQISNSTAI